MRYLLIVAWSIAIWGISGCAGAGRGASGYWVQEQSGKTHNYTCRYYAKCKGHYTLLPTGNDCRICGGASRR